MFTDKLTLAIAESAKKCMDEELKGNQHKIDANKNGKVDAHDFKLLRKQKGVSEELKGNQHKIDANKNGKIDAHDFKLLRKEDSVQEGMEEFAKAQAKKRADARKAKEKTVNEESSLTYVAHSHDGRKANIEAGSSYEAHRKAIKHFDAPKAKYHMVHVKLAKKDGKDVVHTATESVQEGAIDDLRDRQAAAREANPFKAPANKQEPAKRTVQGYQYGGTKQKHEKEVEESVQIEESGGKVVYTKGEDHVEMYGEDAYAVYKNGKKQKFYSTLSAAKEALKEEVEELDESKAHIEQHLADRDINSKVTGKTVKVHSSNLASAKKHVAKAGYKDHKVVGGLNEEKMSDEDMSQREKIVKGMKKNLQGFKARYGADAEKVMYATATKQAMKEDVKESRGHKVLSTFSKNRDIVQDMKKQSPEEKAEHEKKHREAMTNAHNEYVKKNPNSIFKPMKEEKKDKYDEGEYDREGDMAKSDLRSIIANAQKLHDMIEDADNLPEWVQSKITKSEDYISTVANYMTSEMSEAVEYKGIGTDVVDKKKKLNPQPNLTMAKKQVKDFKEEVEQIDELSKQTLGSYVKKAEADRDDSIKRYNSDERDAQGNKIRDKDLSPARKAIDKMMFKRSDKRIAGLKTANAKLAKEEVEELDEISKATLGSYVKKAGKQATKFEVDFEKGRDKGTYNFSSLDKAGKRQAGISKAVDKLAKEEVEQIDELTKATLGSYVKKVSDDISKRDVRINTALEKDIRANTTKAELKQDKRKAGMHKAIDRLTKEEVTNDQFKAELEDNKAKAAGTKKQPDVAKASVQSVKQESFSEKLSMLKENARSYLKDKNNG
jgi:hypothetical protein